MQQQQVNTTQPLSSLHKMESTASVYAKPSGCFEIPQDELDLRPDSAIDHDILHPVPISGERNIWFYWHNGYANMHPYTRRNVRAYVRRFSKKGWVVRVVDREPSSAQNVSQYLDVKDPKLFPQAFIDGTITGRYAIQHSSDLVRWPLLLKYGGVYADVGFIQIGDLDRLWNETIGNPDSPYELMSYNVGGVEGRNLTNYFFAAAPGNALFSRAHRLLLALWAADGGKTCTDGMHASPLIANLPSTWSDMSFDEDGVHYGPDKVREMLSDYIIQGHALSMAMSILDPEDGWNGPEYTTKHVFAIDYMVGSQLINDMTAWNGPRQFELMSLPLPKDGGAESDDQRLARDIVEACLTKSFGFKLATGLILRVHGDTLSSLWRKHTGSDCVPGTYADWLRQGTIYWSPKEMPERLSFEKQAPCKTGPLLAAQ